MRVKLSLLFIAFYALGSQAAIIPSSTPSNVALLQSKAPLSKEAKLDALVDTPYKLAANYLPLLALRALTESHFYRKARSAHIQRRIYSNPAQASTAELLEEIEINLKATKTGFSSREIRGTGRLNDMKLEVWGKMGFGITRRGDMELHLTLDSLEVLNLKINMNGISMHNDIEGIAFKQKVKYSTQLRDTTGKLGNNDYKVFVKGVHDKPIYMVNSNGSIGSYPITGHGEEIKPGHFEIVENYGPLLIKTTVTVRD